MAEIYGKAIGLKVRRCPEDDHVKKVVIPDAYRRWYYCRHIYDRTRMPPRSLPPRD
ncbi:MAG: hypothetical protein J6L87_07025 [Clostridia bacterium]|nr:hypothetical protein [Clostridia bacterium]